MISADAHSKLDRSAELSAELRRCVEDWGARNPFEVRIVERDEAPHREWVAHVSEAPPRHLALLTGDCLHNLRSALDILACDLIRGAGGAIGSHAVFPIADSPAKTRHIVRSHLGALSKTQQTRVEEAIRPRQPELFLLHRLDIADKHRLLMPVLAALRAVNIAMPIPQLPDAAALDPIRLSLTPAQREIVTDGTVLFREDERAPWDHDPQFAIELVLNEPSCGVLLEPLGPLLERLATAAGEIVAVLAPRDGG